MATEITSYAQFQKDITNINQLDIRDNQLVKLNWFQRVGRSFSEWWNKSSPNLQSEIANRNMNILNKLETLVASEKANTLDSESRVHTALTSTDNLPEEVTAEHLLDIRNAKTLVGNLENITYENFVKTFSDRGYNNNIVNLMEKLFNDNIGSLDKSQPISKDFLNTIVKDLESAEKLIDRKSVV